VSQATWAVLPLFGPKWLAFANCNADPGTQDCRLQKTKNALVNLIEWRKNLERNWRRRQGPSKDSATVSTVVLLVLPQKLLFDAVSPPPEQINFQKQKQCLASQPIHFE